MLKGLNLGLVERKWRHSAEMPLHQIKIMSTRNGKIARLPRMIRNKLNQRLDDGEEGKKLLGWLNRLPEVRAVMAESFEGKPVTEQNLSEWKAGGFAEWAQRQEFLAQARELADDAEELRSVAGKGQSSFSEHLSTVLAMRYAGVLKGWQGEASEEMTKQLRLLHGLSHDVARLARVGLERQKVELTREKSQAELVELFSEWMKIPKVREVVCEDYVSVEERRRAAYEAYGLPYPEAVQGPRSKKKSKGRGKRQGNKCQGNGRRASARGKGSRPGRARSGTRGAFRDTRGGCAPRAGKMGNFTSEPLRTKSGRRRWLKDPTKCDALGRDLPEVKAAARKRKEEEKARWYIPKRPGCEQQGPMNPVATGNPTQSDPVVPPAMEAEIARLNASTGFSDEGDENSGRDERGRDDSDPSEWDEEDERVVKQAEEGWKRREAARKEAEQKRMDEENRLWRVQCHFEEPTQEDIALGRDKVFEVQCP